MLSVKFDSSRRSSEGLLSQKDKIKQMELFQSFGVKKVGDKK